MFARDGNGNTPLLPLYAAKEGRIKSLTGSLKSLFQTPSADPEPATTTSTTSDSDPTNSLLNGWFRQADSDPCFPTSLSRKQRIFGFFTCLLLGSLFLSLSFVMLPMLLLKARKFAILYSIGSLCILSSFSMLWGPFNHIKHLCSGPRIAFSAVYLFSLFGTLYVAMSLHSAILSIVFIILQMAALIWYCISYIPGGHTGMKMFAKLFYATASKTVKSLPV